MVNREALKNKVGAILTKRVDQMVQEAIKLEEETDDVWLLLEYIDLLSDDLNRIESQVDRLRYSMDFSVERDNLRKLLDMFEEDSGMLKDA